VLALLPSLYSQTNKCQRCLWPGSMCPLEDTASQASIMFFRVAISSAKVSPFSRNSCTQSLWLLSPVGTYTVLVHPPKRALWMATSAQNRLSWRHCSFRWTQFLYKDPAPYLPTAVVPAETERVWAKASMITELCCRHRAWQRKL
jgi:hypothetical protein